MDDLQDLYQSILLEHNKRPRHKGSLPPPVLHAEGNNPMCGDEVEVFVRLEAGRIAQVSFDGQGCAISQASASMMTEALVGKTPEEAHALWQQLQQLLTDKHAQPSPEDLVQLGDLAALSGVKQFPARIKCATLAWHALEAALAAEPSVSTEQPG